MVQPARAKQPPAVAKPAAASDNVSSMWVALLLGIISAIVAWIWFGGSREDKRSDTQDQQDEPVIQKEQETCASNNEHPQDKEGADVAKKEKRRRGKQRSTEEKQQTPAEKPKTQTQAEKPVDKPQTPAETPKPQTQAEKAVDKPQTPAEKPKPQTTAEKHKTQTPSERSVDKPQTPAEKPKPQTTAEQQHALAKKSLEKPHAPAELSPGKPQAPSEKLHAPAELSPGKPQAPAEQSSGKPQAPGDKSDIPGEEPNVLAEEPVDTLQAAVQKPVDKTYKTLVKPEAPREKPGKLHGLVDKTVEKPHHPIEKIVDKPHTQVEKPHSPIGKPVDEPYAPVEEPPSSVYEPYASAKKPDVIPAAPVENLNSNGETPPAPLHKPVNVFNASLEKPETPIHAPDERLDAPDAWLQPPLGTSQTPEEPKPTKECLFRNVHASEVKDETPLSQQGGQNDIGQEEECALLANSHHKYPEVDSVFENVSAPMAKELYSDKESCGLSVTYNVLTNDHKVTIGPAAAAPDVSHTHVENAQSNDNVLIEMYKATDVPETDKPDTVTVPITSENVSDLHKSTLNNEMIAAVSPVSDIKIQEIDPAKIKRIAAVHPMPQKVKVDFKVHYYTQSDSQVIAVIGDHEQLGGWEVYVPLTYEKDGFWSHSVALPADTRVEWKFVMVENGKIKRWEECSNRNLQTEHDDIEANLNWGYN